MPRSPVGLIGLGLLGAALAERLLAAGFPLVGHDLRVEACDAFATCGGVPVGSASEVFRRAERIVLSLPDDGVVRAVLDAAAATLQSGQVLIDTTTGDPDATADLAAALAVQGVAYVDATVLGSSEVARAGQAVVLAGGDAALVAAAADLFATFAHRWFHAGPAGAGARMKLAVNLVLGLNRAALAEGLAFGRRCGLDPTTLLEALRAGAAYSRVMDAKGRKMLTRDFRPQARLRQHLKDVGLILAQARRTGARVPLSEAHRVLLQAVVDAGGGDDDNSAILRAFE